MNDDERRKRIKEAIERELGQPSKWYWLSFADDTKPPGSQWLGVAIVGAPGFGTAVAFSHLHKINPGGQVRGHELQDEPPEAMRNRLFTDQDELDRLMREWTGEGITKWPTT